MRRVTVDSFRFPRNPRGRRERDRRTERSEIARTIRPESLRARFGEDKQFNAVHCVDLPEDGPLEVDFFFNLSHRHTIAA